MQIGQLLWLQPAPVTCMEVKMTRANPSCAIVSSAYLLLTSCRTKWSENSANRPWTHYIIQNLSTIIATCSFPSSRQSAWPSKPTCPSKTRQLLLTVIQNFGTPPTAQTSQQGLARFTNLNSGALTTISQGSKTSWKENRFAKPTSRISPWISPSVSVPIPLLQSSKILSKSNPHARQK